MLNAEPPVFEDFNVNEINTSEQSEINRIYPSVKPVMKLRRLINNLTEIKNLSPSTQASVHLHQITYNHYLLQDRFLPRIAL